MGLSDDKLVDADRVPAGLRCAICTDVFRDPVCGVSCTHIFCSTCIGRALATRSQCPLCRAAITQTQLRKSQPIQSLLDDLQVRCDYRISGCGWTGRLQDCAAHQAVCPVRENEKLRAELKSAIERGNKLMQDSGQLAKRLKVANERALKLEADKAMLQAEVSNKEVHIVRLEETLQLTKQALGRASNSDSVQVFVKDPNGKTHIVHFSLGDDLYEIQQLISSKTGWGMDMLYLTGMGRILHSGMVARDHGIRRDVTLYMNARRARNISVDSID